MPTKRVFLLFVNLKGNGGKTNILWRHGKLLTAITPRFFRFFPIMNDADLESLFCDMGSLPAGIFWWL